MKFNHRQQPKGNLSLCVCEKYKNAYFIELKNKINSQMPFLIKNGVREIDLQQSNISESCYIKIYLKNYKYPSFIRVSAHYGMAENNIIIDKPNGIKNTLHFNKIKMDFIEKEIIEIEKHQREINQF